MNYGKDATEKKLKDASSKKRKIANRFFLGFTRTLLLIFFVLAVVGVSVGVGMYKGIIDSSPEINIDSIVPQGFATTVYDREGNLTDTLVTAGSNRDPATFDELPKDLINAFVAIEDSRFWTHNGIDLRSIARMIKGVITGDSSAGGGSTITQQLIKNNVFGGGREKSFGETVERKLQEQYLAVKLSKTMSKELILTNYLNTINLGNNALGVKVAARRYFGKEVSDLTLSECTVIAGITQNPSRLNPISGRERNEEKRRVILQYMFEQGYISKDQQEEALADNVYDRIQIVDSITKENSTPYSYFTDELTSQVKTTLMEKLGYSETQAHNLLYSGGLQIYTTQDPKLQAIVDEEINNPDNYNVVRYSIEYRLSLQHADGTKEHFSQNNIKAWHKDILQETDFDALYNSEEEARGDAENFKNYIKKDTDEVIGESITVTLQPQISFVLMDQATGEVKAISGGRGAKTANLTLNRATNVPRQPGSTFKVISSFAPALDTCGATLGSVYYDAPYTVGTKTFRNWYSGGYQGYSSIRDGIIYSMNIVAVRCMMETVTIANQGMYTEPIFFTKIIDRNGKVLINNEPATRRVLKDSTAFLLTDALKDSMIGNRKFARPGAGPGSTSTRAKLENMSCAGKSGTTTGNNDIWFVGFTPYYTAGIWSGYDLNQKLSSHTEGTSYHKDIWRKIMTRVHEGMSDPGFTVPDSVETASICRKSGKLAIPGVCDHDPRGNAIYTEYFAKGTVPTESCNVHTTVTVCAESGMLPTEFCPEKISRVCITLPAGETGETDDSYFAIPGYCPIHGSTSTVLPSESDATSPTVPYGPGYITVPDAPPTVPTVPENIGPGFSD